MLGVIGGTVFFKKPLFGAEREDEIGTEHGKTLVHIGKNIAFIPRHGPTGQIPAHNVNHKANILALKKLGVREIIGVNSAGSLKPEIKPGSIAVPSDYMNFAGVQTFFDSQAKHVTPALSETLKNKLLDAAGKLGIQVIGSGTYFQSRGPRLETPAESAFLAEFADFVGMTLASEATLAREQEMEYAAICSIDNYANGISGAKPTHKRIVESAGKNAEKIWKIIEAISEGKK